MISCEIVCFLYFRILLRVRMTSKASMLSP
jgi:hypothetical protein